MTDVELEANQARTVADLLELLAQVPSTPEGVAEEAHDRAGHLNERLPAQPRHAGAGARSAVGVVRIERDLATSVAGLLDLLGGLPSTSPGVADEASDHAQWIWEQLG
ncbi:hypothetical protein BH20ACT8_BH20ACT8_09190 [soil metagenome]|jgi:hypothetical protein